MRSNVTFCANDRNTRCTGSGPLFLSSRLLAREDDAERRHEHIGGQVTSAFSRLHKSARSQ